MSNASCIGERRLWLLVARLVALLMTGIFTIAGDAQARSNEGIGIYVDQDFFVPGSNEDRDYTMGLAFEYFQQDSQFYLFDRGIRWFGDLLGIDVSGDEARRSYMIGSVNYTPDDLSAKQVLTDDRPYSSLIYLANKRVVADGEKALGVEFQAGILGTYVAREVQTAAHTALRNVSGDDEPVDPQGWRNQISAGGEPTGRIRVAYSHLLWEASDLLDVSGTADFSLGYQTNASVGGAVRLGYVRSPFWSLPYDPINRGNFVPSFSGNEIYLWAAFRARLVGYDALLQGQFRDSAHTIEAGDVRRLVQDSGVGVTGAVGDVQLTLAVNRKSSEIRGGRGDRSQIWGGVYATWRF